MSRDFHYDVFLSHNQADKPRVRRLAERLQAAGVRVWFDEWVINPGDDIYLAIERGLEASRTLVLCLSPAALGSDWVGLERSTVLFRDPSNTGRRFIPVQLADCSLPDTLRRYKLFDFRRDSSRAFQRLLAACLPGEPLNRETESPQPVNGSVQLDRPDLRILYDNADLIRAEQIRARLESAGFRVELGMLPLKNARSGFGNARIVALLLSTNTKRNLFQKLGKEHGLGRESRLLVLCFGEAPVPKKLRTEYSIAFQDGKNGGLQQLFIELSV